MADFKSLNEKLIYVQQNTEEIDKLIGEYKPFIASTVESHLGRYVEYGVDDELSIALMAFNEAIKKYDISRGNFLTFARITIKHRLIDYYRREKRNPETVSYVDLSQEDDEEPANLFINESIKEYTDRELSELRKMEILQIKKELATWGISFADVAKSSPKQRGTKKTYLKAINFIMETPEILDIIKTKRYLPVEKVCTALKIPRKRIERGRNYIVAAVLILSGDYQFINDYIQWR